MRLEKKEKIKKEQKDILRVVAYTRVSNLEKNGTHSALSQKLYYKNKIQNNKNWILVNIYSDDGISGSTIKGRDNFLRMIVDADRGKYDFIITKSISRFARNTLDTIKYVRFLKARGIGIYFEEENINTLDMSSELVLTILSSVAQQEIINLSESISYGIHQKMKEGKPIGFKGCYGYKYDNENDSFEIIEEEAEIVRKIFNMYKDGYGIEKIKQYLNNNKIPTKNNSEFWRGSVIMKMLRNEKYVGELLLGKNCTVDHLENKKVIKNKGQSNMYHVKNNHEPIIDENTFYEVQKIIDSNCKTFQYKTLNGMKALNRYCFSNHLRCGFCGGPLQRNVPSKYSEPNYRCVANEKIQKGLCNNSKTAHVSFLENIFVEAINKYIKSRVKIDNPVINNKLRYINGILNGKLIKKFDDELFKQLVYMIIFGRNNNGEIETHSIRIIIRTNRFIKKHPVKTDVLNHTFYKILEYRSDEGTNWREYRTNILHKISNSYVSIEVDLENEI